MFTLKELHNLVLCIRNPFKWNKAAIYSIYDTGFNHLTKCRQSILIVLYEKLVRFDENSCFQLS